MAQRDARHISKHPLVVIGGAAGNPPKLFIGATEMNYRIETKEAFRIIGVSAPLDKEIENNFMAQAVHSQFRLPNVPQYNSCFGLIFQPIP